MRFFIHVRDGEKSIHSWTNDEWISDAFMTQRKYDFNTSYKRMVISLKKEEKLEFMENQESKRLMVKGDKDIVILTDSENISLSESCAIMVLELSQIKNILLSYGVDGRLMDLVDYITPEIPVMEDQGVVFSNVDALRTINLKNLLCDMINESE